MREERIALGKCIINVTRLLRDGLNARVPGLGDKEGWGALILILNAVMLGHAEGRPLSGYKIAEIVGLPRPTVIRKLKELEKYGFIVRSGRAAYVLSKERAAPPEMGQWVDRLLGILMPVLEISRRRQLSAKANGGQRHGLGRTVDA